MEDRKLGYLIKNINDKLKTKADADLKEHNLTLSQCRVLEFLNSRGGQATQKEIEDFLEVSHPTVVGIVNRMEQNGHLTCWVDGKDRRNKIVQITPQSAAFAHSMTQRIDDSEARMLQSLTQEEIETVIKALRVIYQNIKES